MTGGLKFTLSILRLCLSSFSEAKGVCVCVCVCMCVCVCVCVCVWVGGGGGGVKVYHSENSLEELLKN